MINLTVTIIAHKSSLPDILFVRVYGCKGKPSDRYALCNQDPNNPSSNNANNKQSPQQANEQMLQIIKEAFRNCSQNGMLTKDKFNQALSILEALGFKRLRDTPLADRLFFIFDKVSCALARPTAAGSRRGSSSRASATSSATAKTR